MRTPNIETGRVLLGVTLLYHKERERREKP
jgi:hypothetical protein